MSDVRFFDLTIPAARRLAMMRVAFNNHASRYPRCPDSIKPKNWRDVRAYGFHNWEAAFCAGINPAVDQWYSHGGAQFRGERFADECEGGPDHTGWYTDNDGSESARGIVGRLPHGRFIAGYHWNSNGERVYFPEVFDSERDAARAADRHAEHFAESAREASERFDAMRAAESRAEAVQDDVRHAIDARNASAYWREHCRERISELRAARADLEKARAAYEGA